MPGRASQRMYSYGCECAAADGAQAQEGLGARIETHVNTLHMMLIKLVQYDGYDGWVNQIICGSVSLMFLARVNSDGAPVPLEGHRAISGSILMVASRARRSISSRKGDIFS